MNQLLRKTQEAAILSIGKAPLDDEISAFLVSGPGEVRWELLQRSLVN